MVDCQLRRGLLAVLACLCASSVAVSAAGKPKPTPSPSIPKGASFEERLAVARTVKTITDILGVELGASFDDARAKLDPLNDPGRPPTLQKTRDGGVKALWQFEQGPFASVYIKTDGKRQIEEITGFVRPGEEIPFARVGDVSKAPLLNDNAVVWDVIRADRPPTRVAAEGKERKASLIRLFVVKRRVS